MFDSVGGAAAGLVDIFFSADTGTVAIVRPRRSKSSRLFPPTRRHFSRHISFSIGIVNFSAPVILSVPSTSAFKGAEVRNPLIDEDFTKTAVDDLIIIRELQGESDINNMTRGNSGECIRSIPQYCEQNGSTIVSR